MSSVPVLPLKEGLRGTPESSTTCPSSLSNRSLFRVRVDMRSLAHDDLPVFIAIWMEMGWAGPGGAGSGGVEGGVGGRVGWKVVSVLKHCQRGCGCGCGWTHTCNAFMPSCPVRIGLALLSRSTRTTSSCPLEHALTSRHARLSSHVVTHTSTEVRVGDLTGAGVTTWAKQPPRGPNHQLELPPRRDGTHSQTFRP